MDLKRLRPDSNVRVSVELSQATDRGVIHNAVRLAVRDFGARLSPAEVDDLVVMLLYFKKLAEDANVSEA
jgi:hypothetical protein